MKKLVNAILFYFFICSLLSAEVLKIPNISQNNVNIENLTPNTIIATINIAEINSKEITQDGKAYNAISVNDFSFLRKVGQPALPAHNLSMIINDGSNLNIEVLEQEIEILNNIDIYPYLGEVKIKPDRDEYPKFTLDNTIYKSDNDFPLSFIDGPEIHKHRGVSIADFQIVPFKYNAKLKELKIYKHLKLKISFDGGSRNTKMAVSKEHLKVLKNTTENAEQFISEIGRGNRSILNDNVDDIIIVTIPDFIDAAEKLATWQRMKGYDVLIEAKSWSTSTIKNTVHNFYNQTNPKPSYLVIIGDVDQVPTNMFNEAISNSELMGSDLEYVCMDGSSDTDPDMAKGRISVTTASEANGAIEKIIDYEKNPPINEDYYKNILACTYFQGSSTSQMNFTASIERSASYLENMNKYDINRIYYTASSNNPTTYGYMAPDAGKPVPSYLRKPGFAWDGNANDIIAGMNAGSFFAFHYDHGQDAGWSSPRFMVNDINSLSNTGQYPIVNSINCYSGSFHENLCFAEKMLRVSNSGAAGVFAATIWTLTGSNNEIQQTFVNSIWPGLKSSGEPVYIMADVVEQCYRAIQSYYVGNPGHIKTFVGGYHYFGDPTTVFWTDVPEDINANHASKVYLLDDFTIDDINFSEGMVTILNKESGEVVGKSTIAGSSVSIELDQNLANDKDTLVLTITAHNYRPYQIELLATTDITVKNDITNSKPSTINILLNDLVIPISKNQKNITLSLYSINGKKIFEQKLKNVSKNLMITLPELSNGIYFVKIDNRKRNLFMRNITIY